MLDMLTIHASLRSLILILILLLAVGIDTILGQEINAMIITILGNDTSLWSALILLILAIGIRINVSLGGINNTTTIIIIMGRLFSSSKCLAERIGNKVILILNFNI